MHPCTRAPAITSLQFLRSSFSAARAEVAGSGTRWPCVKLMNEVWRDLKPGGMS
jgi:hypothetical protein